MRKRELTPERRELLTALNSAPEPLTPAALAQRLGKERESVKRLLYKCVDDGQVVAAEGGYTTSEYYRNITRPAGAEFVHEFVHEKGISDTDSAPVGTDNDVQSPPVGTDPVPAHEEAGVYTAVRGGEMDTKKLNPLGIGLFCAEPPNGLPAGTYPAKRDELGRLVPDYSLPALPKDPNFRG
jgi:hypothetical protein